MKKAYLFTLALATLCALLSAEPLQPFRASSALSGLQAYSTYAVTANDANWVEINGHWFPGDQAADYYEQSGDPQAAQWQDSAMQQCHDARSFLGWSTLIGALGGGALGFLQVTETKRKTDSSDMMLQTLIGLSAGAAIGATVGLIGKHSRYVAASREANKAASAFNRFLMTQLKLSVDPRLKGAKAGVDVNF